MTEYRLDVLTDVEIDKLKTGDLLVVDLPREIFTCLVDTDHSGTLTIVTMIGTKGTCWVRNMLRA